MKNEFMRHEIELLKNENRLLKELARSQERLIETAVLIGEAQDLIIEKQKGEISTNNAVIEVLRGQVGQRDLEIESRKSEVKYLRENIYWMSRRLEDAS